MRQLAKLLLLSMSLSQTTTMVFAQGINVVNKVTDGHELGLMIVGAITNANKKENVALVKETTSGRIKAVKIGFPILDSYKVSEVTAKYVMLSKGDQSVLVYQNKFAGEFTKNIGVPPPAANHTATNESYSEDGFERKGNQVTVTPGFRDKMINEDLSKVLMQATAIPKVENGEIVGFRVLQIDAGSIYDKAGIRDEDVITAINGVKLNNVAGAVRLLQSLRNSSGVEIELNRSGAPQKIDLRVAH